MTGVLELIGVRVHNLKNLHVRIPHHRLVVITGPSGSGKSSLAFDTIFTEGQRRYVESLNPYVRQFLERMEKPDLDSASGITPAVAVGRTPPPRSRRSTVATMTEVADVLRLLFARLGTVICPGCGGPIHPDTPDRLTDLLLGRLAAGEGPLMLASPMPACTDRKDALARLRAYRKEGYIRLWWQGRVHRLNDSEQELRPLAKALLHGHEPEQPRPALLIDRLTASAPRSRVREGIENAYREGQGVMLLIPAGGTPQRYTEGHVCAGCLREVPLPQPHLFSFNSPYGACPDCQGFGARIAFLPERVVPDPARSLAEGAIEPWSKPAYRRWQQRLERLAGQGPVRLDVPWKDLTEEEQERVWKGWKGFPGVRGFWAKLDRKKYRLPVRVFMARFRSYVPCETCGGTRLRAEARQVFLGGLDIAALQSGTVREVRDWLDGLTLSPERRTLFAPLLRQARDRLEYLEEVGVGYLTLDRLSRTLSGGESQRIGLASVLGAALVDTTYVLDEPSVGLHPRDVGRLLRIVRRLRDRGNTVIVVEHDRQVIAAADLILDLGPGSGRQGGELVYTGALHGLQHEADTATSRYLQGRIGPFRPLRRREPGAGWIEVCGAAAHNLKQIDVRFPRGMLTAVTGVSGSGKTTLLYDILAPALQQKLGRPSDRSPGSHRELRGWEGIGGVESLDQRPLSTNRRSNAATYMGAWTGIRKLFAETEAARRRGLGPGAFSFNTRGGRCPECLGAGSMSVDMQFMADVVLRCDRCHGRRFTPRVLEVRYRGRTIADVLDLTVDQAVSFFASQRGIVRGLEPLQRVGLGYLQLGQPAPTLSGGEAQRLTLAVHLGPRRGQPTLYLFDEPTTGLHGTEIGRLVDCLEDLVEQGHTVLVIEHNMDLVLRADWVIDLGPEGGDQGGELVGEGRPEQLAREGDSHTAQALCDALKHRGASR